MRFSVRLILAIILLLAIPGMGQSTSPLDSALEDNLYTNFFFRIRYPFSASWIPQSMAAFERIPETSQRCLSNAGTSPERSHNLLTLARNLPGQGLAGRSRAIIVIIAEDLSSETDVASGKDCVQKISERLRKDHFTLVGEPKEVQLSGVSFFRQDLKGRSSAGAPKYKSVFYTLTKGYALGFILTAPNEQMWALMLETLDKVKFF